MENISTAFLKIRGDLAELHNGFKQGMEWYKQEMNNLKVQLENKDKEIEYLKKKLNEKSS